MQVRNKKQVENNKLASLVSFASDYYHLNSALFMKALKGEFAGRLVVKYWTYGTEHFLNVDYSGFALMFVMDYMDKVTFYRTIKIDFPVFRQKKNNL
jgi:hypothetical protein